MEIINIQDFIENCEKGICFRNTFISLQCLKLNKQKKCYKKYKLKEEEKIRIIETGESIDVEWENVRREVWYRDAGCEPIRADDMKINEWIDYCSLWNYLNDIQKQFILKSYKQELWLNRYLDCAHIYPKDLYPKLKYDIDNVVLLGRYFHKLLDDYKDPITKQKISEEIRLEWMIKSKENKGEK